MRNLNNTNIYMFQSTMICATLRNSCIKCNNIDKAENLYKEMKKNNLQKNAYIYSTIIKCYNPDNYQRKNCY
jgi:pentatricopeptide repeat protein